LQKIITVGQRCESQIVIKKSRFITTVVPINNIPEAEKHIKEVKAKYSDANHNVYAYIVAGDQNYSKCNDDGEPSGTAGRPILEVISKMGLSNVVVVVSRYFGGILLGAGGLVRAYTEAAKTGIHEAGMLELIPHVQYTLKLKYEQQRELKSIVKAVNGQVEEISYQENITCQVCLPMENNQEFIDNLGDIKIQETHECYR
jgi:uncharacterized YigZ family protein